MPTATAINVVLDCARYHTCPEGGDGGGRIVAEGTPEEICRVAESYTGKYLAPYLETKARSLKRA